MGRRSLAAQLVQAIAEPVAFVAKFLGESSGVEMGTARAVLVNRAAVGKFWTTEFIKFRKLAESDELQERAEQNVGIGGATGQSDHHFAFENFVYTAGTGGIGIGRRYTAPGSARADRDNRPS